VLVLKDAAVLETQSAGAEPFVLGHAADENAFGFGLRLAFFLEAGGKGVVFFAVFVLKEVEEPVVMAEAVGGAVLGRGLLASLRRRSGGMSRVLLIGANLCGGGHVF
jgi:hypothetical protein